ncbi:N-acetyltransferase [Salinisphaera sp. P385]|uniref:N-acetyltransferase n=1 Tax=Spectribacter acetivorans TaxID=3075603 RepID=A0ABU3B7T1_9GAMM|nr:N-acetyltransferase [Salinisphaera sp. P385]MDT0617056.1 N-acetyltransferase [Salinisphaera sp. P385]
MPPHDPDLPFIRPVEPADLDAIVALERRCFDRDTQTRRSLRYLLTRANAINLAAECDGRLTGYLTLLLRRGAQAARVYSIAVDPAARGRGLAGQLLHAAEAHATRRDCNRMVCEVRASNQTSLALFTSHGYQRKRDLPAYYPGGEDGVRLEKRLT